MKSASPEETPAPPAEPSEDEAKPARRSWKRRLLIFGIPLLVVVAAAAWGVNYYLTAVPEQLADDYHEKAEPEFERVDTAMDRVFDSFNRYVDRSTIAAKKLRGKDEDEAKKLLIPVYDRRDADLKTAEKAIEETRKRIKKARTVLADTPSRQFLDEKDPIVATRAANRKARDYFRRATRYLDSYGEFIRSEAKTTNLLRRQVTVTADQPSTAGLEPSVVADNLNATIDDLEKIDADARRLEPHRDTVELYRSFRDGLTSYIVYLEDIVTAFETLDPGLADAAYDRLIEETDGSRKRESKLLADFRFKSGLAMATRSLGSRANDVAAAISETEADSGE